MPDVWEVKVEMRVRKTFRFEGGGNDEDIIRKTVAECLQSSLWKHLQYCEFDYGAPRPVEELIDNNPAIVSIQRLSTEASS